MSHRDGCWCDTCTIRELRAEIDRLHMVIANHVAEVERLRAFLLEWNQKFPRPELTVPMQEDTRNLWNRTDAALAGQP